VGSTIQEKFFWLFKASSGFPQVSYGISISTKSPDVSCKVASGLLQGYYGSRMEMFLFI